MEITITKEQAEAHKEFCLEVVSFVQDTYPGIAPWNILINMGLGGMVDAGLTDEQIVKIVKVSVEYIRKAVLCAAKPSSAPQSSGG